MRREPVDVEPFMVEPRGHELGIGSLLDLLLEYEYEHEYEYDFQAKQRLGAK